MKKGDTSDKIKVSFTDFENRDTRKKVAQSEVGLYKSKKSEHSKQVLTNLDHSSHLLKACVRLTNLDPIPSPPLSLKLIFTQKKFYAHIKNNVTCKIICETRFFWAQTTTQFEITTWENDWICDSEHDRIFGNMIRAENHIDRKQGSR